MMLQSYFEVFQLSEVLKHFSRPREVYNYLLLSAHKIKNEYGCDCSAYFILSFFLRYQYPSHYFWIWIMIFKIKKSNRPLSGHLRLWAFLINGFFTHE